MRIIIMEIISIHLMLISIRVLILIRILILIRQLFLLIIIISGNITSIGITVVVIIMIR